MIGLFCLSLSISNAAPASRQSLLRKSVTEKLNASPVRHKRFGYFNYAEPSSSEKCLMACGQCAPDTNYDVRIFLGIDRSYLEIYRYSLMTINISGYL